jgi:hypothetical protein
LEPLHNERLTVQMGIFVPVTLPIWTNEIKKEICVYSEASTI